MTECNFIQQLQAKWAEGKLVCVGLNSDKTKLPATANAKNWATFDGVKNSEQFGFNVEIVLATHDVVCAFKLDPGYYVGSKEKEVLRATIGVIHEEAPDVPVILDVKQASIDNTNDGYVKEDFDWYGADAVTVNPYLGMEAMKPFLERTDKGIIVLCRTSNPGAGEFQDRYVQPSTDEWSRWTDDPEGMQEYLRQVVETGGLEIPSPVPSMPFYQLVAYRVAREWNANGNCALVVGATYPEELAKVRKIVGDMPILIPGAGEQDGDVEATVKAGADSHGQGMIINSARGIIFASSGDDFAGAARAETLKLHDAITAALATI